MNVEDPRRQGPWAFPPQTSSPSTSSDLSKWPRKCSQQFVVLARSALDVDVSAAVSLGVSVSLTSEFALQPSSLEGPEAAVTFGV